MHCTTTFLRGTAPSFVTGLGTRPMFCPRAARSACLLLILAVAMFGARDSHSEPAKPAEAAADDTAQAEAALLKAAEAGDVESQYRLGYALVRRARISDGVTWLRKSAEAGHAEAAYELSWWDIEREIHWIRLAAERGHAEAQYTYGLHLTLGYLVDKDPVEGTKWFRMSAEQGYAEAQYKIGLCHLGGCVLPKDRAEALRWIRLAAEQGLDEARDAMALLMWDDGQYGDAVAWAELAAQSGHAPAQYNLALFLTEDVGIPLDRVQALVWCELAAAQGEERAVAKRQSFVDQVPPARLPEAWHRLGMAYIQAEGIDQDYAKAREWLQRAANAGYAPAQHRLGVLAREGGPGAPKNSEDAERWLLAAARQGHAEAQLYLGSAYMSYFDDAPKPEEARKWFLAAAESGNAAAYVHLGHMYHTDDYGVRQDHAEAAKWYLRAAAVGEVFAYMLLAQLYADPSSSVHDPVQAYYWFARAIADGDLFASEQLAKLESSMTPEQRSRAKRLLADSAPPGPQRAEPASDSTAASHEPVGSATASPAGPLTSGVPRGPAGSNPVLEAQRDLEAATAKKREAQAAHEAALAHLAALDGKDAALKARLEAIKASAGQLPGSGPPIQVPDAVAPELSVDFVKYELALRRGRGTVEMLQTSAPTRFASWNAAAHRGDPFGLLLVSRCLDLGLMVPEDPDRAFTLCRQSAELGLPHAQNHLGYMHHFGRGTAVNLPLAAAWYQKAADQGLAQAQVNLAKFLYHGAEGIPQDHRRAYEWTRKAAEAGHADAQHLMGVFYSNGTVVPKDPAIAATWFERSALQEFVFAQEDLGKLYAAGHGVPQSIATAELWLRKAADQGSEGARQELRRLQLNAPTAAEVLAALQEREAFANFLLASAEGMRNNYDKDNLFSIAGALVGEFMRDTRIELQNFKLHRVGRAKDGAWIAEWSARLHFSGVIGEASAPNPLNIGSAFSELTVNQTRLVQRADGTWRAF